MTKKFKMNMMVKMILSKILDLVFQLIFGQGHGAQAVKQCIKNLFWIKQSEISLLLLEIVQMFNLIQISMLMKMKLKRNNKKLPARAMNHKVITGVKSKNLLSNSKI